MPYSLNIYSLSLSLHLCLSRAQTTLLSIPSSSSSPLRLWPIRGSRPRTQVPIFAPTNRIFPTFWISLLTILLRFLGDKITLGRRLGGKPSQECTPPFTRSRSMSGTASSRDLLTGRTYPGTLAWSSLRIRNPASGGRRSSTRGSWTLWPSSVALTVRILSD